MDNLISRQAAIDLMLHALDDDWELDYAEARMNELPSAQPEQKKGKWIERNPQNSERCRLIECNQCGYSHIVGFNVSYEDWIKNRNFCQECGSFNGGIGNDAEL